MSEITTVEQLEALPVGAVVGTRLSDGAMSIATKNTEGREFQWTVDGETDHYTPDGLESRLGFPLTLLHPTPQPSTDERDVLALVQRMIREWGEQDGSDWAKTHLTVESAIDAAKYSVVEDLKEIAAGFHRTPAPAVETTHACPPDGSGGLTPCCGRTPFELPRTDRMTITESLVTCNRTPAPSGDYGRWLSQQGKVDGDETYGEWVSAVVDRYTHAPSDDQVERVAEALAEHTLGATWGDDGITFVGCDCGKWFGKEIDDGWDRARAHQARAAIAAMGGAK